MSTSRPGFPQLHAICVLVCMLVGGMNIVFAAVSSTTTLNSGISPATFGEAVALTATVSPTAATGKVTFYDGATILGIAPVSSGHAALNARFYTSGTRRVTARYGGDATYASSISQPLALTVNTVAAQSLAPTPFSPLPIGPSQPVSLAVADFNGDGFPDFAVLTQYNSLLIFLSDGNGGFRIANSMQMPIGVSAIAAGDFNGDGLADIAITYSFLPSTVTIYLGDGNGGFTPSSGSPYAAGDYAGPIAVADFNGDGKADLAILDANINQVTILLGDGIGGFAFGSKFVTSGIASFCMATGDFNGDGIPDLAIGSDKVTIFLGDGSGRFIQAPGSPLTLVNDDPEDIKVADLDGDGVADLVVSGVSTVRLYQGQGDGRFLAASGSPVYASTTHVLHSQVLKVAVADFNADGLPDIAVVELADSTLTILTKSGVNGFAFNSSPGIYAGNGPGYLALTDFNADGRPDLLIGDTQSFGMMVMLGSGTKIAATTTTVSLANSPARFGYPIQLVATITPSTATGRVTFYDGLTFLGDAPVSGGTAVVTTSALQPGARSITARYSGDANDATSSSAVLSITVTVNAPFGYAAATGSPFGAGTGPSAEATGDFNKDRKTDLAILNPATNSVSVLLGNGSGSFSAASGSPLTVGNNPSGIAVGDVNNDGVMDLLVASIGDADVEVFFGNGTGGFTNSGIQLPIINPQALLVQDINADGNADILVLTSAGVVVFLGDGAGHFGPYGGTTAVGNVPSAMVAADFNSDGCIDVAVANRGDNTVTLLLGNCYGGFAPATIFGSPYPVGLSPTALAVGDFNGDGIPDVAVANSGRNSVTILLFGYVGNSLATYSSASPISVGLSPISIATGDFNADGRTDIVVANRQSNNVFVLLGDGSGGFTPVGGSPFAVGTSPSAVVVGDFNGDAIPDFAIANSGSNNLSIIVGTAEPLGFFTLNPCRAADTRASQQLSAPFGPPVLQPYSGRNFPLSASGCGLPPQPQAYSLNLTVVPREPLDFLTAWPNGQGYPGVSNLNSTNGLTLANAAIVPAGAGGGVEVVAGEVTDLIIDVNGYFAPPNGQDLAFYPVTPCRVADTRTGQNKPMPFGPPVLAGYQSRDFAIPSSGCGIPSSAKAYSMNFTVVPQGPLDFLSTWPARQGYPGVSTLNSTDGSVIANAAIVPAGSDGGITVVAGHPTDFIIDINGYFAAPGGPGALHFYAVTPCRVMDTRAGQGKSGLFGPPALTGGMMRDVPISGSPCSIPASASAYALNVTAVPQGSLSFLSIWPAGQGYPGVSTLNSPTGATLANMAIVPAGTNGSITLLPAQSTDLIIDINGYFAP